MDEKKQVDGTNCTISIWSLVKTYILGKKLILLMGCLLLVSVNTFIQPLIIKGITDEGMLKANMQVIIFFAMLLLFTFIVEGIANMIQTKQFAEIQKSMTRSLYQLAFEKIFRLKKSYFTDHNGADIMNRISTDISSVSMIADQGILFVISYILSIAAGILGLVFLNWKMAFIVLAAIPFKIILCVKLSKLNEKTIAESMELMQTFSSFFGDVIRGIKEIKLWNLIVQKKTKLLEQQQQILQKSKASTIYNCYNNIFSSLLDSVVKCSLYAYGGFLFVTGDLTLGGVTAFIAYSGNVLNPITALMSVGYLFSNIRPSLERLNHFFCLEEEESRLVIADESENIENVDSLEVQHLQFSYSREKLLTDANFSVHMGQKAAIIGANGSGKSTLIDLILKFEKPEFGEILVNGIDIASYSNAQYRNLFSVVEQEPYFFKDSVRNNVDPKGCCSDEHIYSVFAQCGIMDFFQERFHGDLNSVIRYDAADLSGGERKRLALARALLKDSPILIMDEVAADYDLESEMKLRAMLASRVTDKIVLYITHNYSYLDIFDAVYQLADGKLKKLRRDEVLKLKNRAL